MPDLELDFEIAGEGTLDEWRVDGVSLVSLFRALLGVLMGGHAGVFPRTAAADAACALVEFQKTRTLSDAALGLAPTAQHAGIRIARERRGGSAAEKPEDVIRRVGPGPIIAWPGAEGCPG
jgi:hypothetical protein